MKIWMFLWVLVVLVARPVYSTPGRADPQPRGNAFGHQNQANPHYVETVVEETPTFEVCPFIQSAPHMCVNFNPTP